MKSRGYILAVILATVALVAGTVVASPDPDPETFSIDGPPAVQDQADLLNPGMTVQVPKANIGLGLNDQLDALSAGVDAVHASNIVYFSVDRASIGLAGPLTPLDVNGQAALNQQAGDIFATTDAQGVGSAPVGINSLHMNQNFFGLIPVVGSLQDNTGNLQDNLDAFCLEEFDLLPLQPDGLQDRAVYFSLGANSPSLGVNSAADILQSPAGGVTFSVFATAAQMGLLAEDDLDALALLDLDGAVTPGLDLALFSLAPGSPTLLGPDGLFGTADDLSAADLFLTAFNNSSFVRYAAGSLGLLAEDNVDGMDVQIPEPASLCLFACGGSLLAVCRRRKV